MNSTTTSTRQPHFKHTRELVRMAIEDGMTQDEIARLCRTQQSVVSSWANGKAKPKREVLEPLIKRYGHRLNRSTARFYLVQHTPDPPWEQTEEEALVRRLLEDPEAYVREVASEEEIAAWMVEEPRRAHTVYDQESREQREVPEPIQTWMARSPFVHAAWDGLGLAAEDDAKEVAKQRYAVTFQRFVRLEGAVVWKHNLGQPRRTWVRAANSWTATADLETTARWILHAVGPGAFRLVSQTLRELTFPEAAIWQESVRRLTDGRHISQSTLLLSADDAARWLSTLHEPTDVAGLLVLIDGLLKEAGPHDRAVVPFTLRKALMEHGHEVGDVEFIPSLF